MGLVAVLLLVGCSGPGRVPGSEATASSSPPLEATVSVPDDTTPSTGPPPGLGALGLAEVRALEAVDGDTLVIGTDERVRLAGIDAPELGECLGSEARASLASIAVGTISVSVDDPPRDQYGRLLGHVFVGTGYVNRAQVERGLAIATSADSAFADDLAAAQERAAAEGAGLWSPAPCGGTEHPELQLVAVDSDPPGPDEHSLDLELVVLENPGHEPVDLDGWVLRDESAVHRFHFPGRVLAPGSRLAVASGCTPPPDTLAWCAEGPVWNNGGDTAFLLDPSGRISDHLRY